MDAQLIHNWQTGDPEAFRTLYERHREDLMRFCYHLTGSTATAQDLFQDTWLRVIESIATLRDPQAFRKHLFRTAYNRAVDQWRRRRVLRFFSLDAPGHDETTQVEHLPSPIAAPDQHLLDLERESQLQNALGQLNADQRAVILLRTQGELSFKEIAEMTHTPLGTVLARMNRGVNRLRELLAEEADHA